MLDFKYSRAPVAVAIESQPSPPRLIPGFYSTQPDTADPRWRLDLLLRNLLEYGTITNTLVVVLLLRGELRSQDD